MSSDAPGFLSTARYGKDKVRVFRTVRGADGAHTVVEYIVSALLEGGIDTRCARRISTLASTHPRELTAPRAKLHAGGQQRRRRDGLKCASHSRARSVSN
jgi:hypothetical protein